MQRTTRSSALAALTLLAATVTFAACGSDTPPDSGGIATIGTTTPADGSSVDANGTVGTGSTGSTDGTGTAELEAPTDLNAAAVLFDRCMAEHDFPTDMAGSLSDGPVTVQNNSSSDDGGPVAMGPGGIEIEAEDMEAFDAANEACRGHLANAQSEHDLSPEQQAAMEDATLRVEQCMQAKGFDVHFDVASGNGTGAGNVNVDEPGDAPSGQAPVDPPTAADRAAMDAAMQECNQVFDDYPELADVPVPGGE
jgi:hypothetical protein